MKLKQDLLICTRLTIKQIKNQYKGSFLGFFWTILNPMLNMLVMWFVFGNIFQYKDPYYPLYILTGNLIFLSLRTATTQSLNSLVLNRSLLMRTKVNLYIFPLSKVCSSICNFFLSLVALLPFMIWLTISNSINLFSCQLLFILLMIPALFLFEYGISLFLCVVYVYFRDISNIYNVFLRLWTYCTPVFYKMTRFDENNAFLKIMKFNPMYHFLNYFRDCVYRGAIGIDTMEKHIKVFIPQFRTLGILYIFGFISIVLGYITFSLLKNKVIIKL